ncbi:hypothetical protein PR048_000926 [Dryococelus australis]|uniref:Uncharacterized protein n=1 Tax=Dryococelus australis TaxID=614101 RepID=A0ABQ9IFY0_9NEOP|nr:hypothetical protein PR048_000926 [Dryococelus australis]
MMVPAFRTRDILIFLLAVRTEASAHDLFNLNLFWIYMKKKLTILAAAIASLSHTTSCDRTKPKQRRHNPRKSNKHQDRLQQLRELNAKRRKKSIDTSPENTLMTFQPDTSQPDMAQPNEAKRVRFTAGSYPDVGIVPDHAGGRRVFSGISRSPALSFRLSSILTSLRLHRLSRPRSPGLAVQEWLHVLVIVVSPQGFCDETSAEVHGVSEQPVSWVGGTPRSTVIDRELVAGKRISWMNRSAADDGWGKRENPKKTRRPTASSGTTRTCENTVTRPGIEPASPWWEASRLTAQPPWPRKCRTATNASEMESPATNIFERGSQMRSRARVDGDKCVWRSFTGTSAVGKALRAHGWYRRMRRLRRRRRSRMSTVERHPPRGRGLKTRRGAGRRRVACPLKALATCGHTTRLSSSRLSSQLTTSDPLLLNKELVLEVLAS